MTPDYVELTIIAEPPGRAASTCAQIHACCRRGARPVPVPKYMHGAAGARGQYLYPNACTYWGAEGERAKYVPCCHVIGG
jgi:hypothetical protein